MMENAPAPRYMKPMHEGDSAMIADDTTETQPSLSPLADAFMASEGFTDACLRALQEGVRLAMEAAPWPELPKGDHRP